MVEYTKDEDFLRRVLRCNEPMSLHFVGRDDLASMLRRQGERTDGSEGEIGAAYMDNYGKGDPHYGVIGAYWNNTLLGVTSFGVIENRNILAHLGSTDQRRAWYGRIDAVVVPSEYRGLGVSRWLLEANLRYMLEFWPGELCSLSTIAAQKAIADILSSLGFSIEVKEGMTEERVSLDMDETQEKKIRDVLGKKVSQSGQLVFFRIRQQGGL